MGETVPQKPSCCPTNPVWCMVFFACRSSSLITVIFPLAFTHSVGGQETLLKAWVSVLHNLTLSWVRSHLHTATGKAGLEQDSPGRLDAQTLRASLGATWACTPVMGSHSAHLTRNVFFQEESLQTHALICTGWLRTLQKMWNVTFFPSVLNSAAAVPWWHLAKGQLVLAQLSWKGFEGTHQECDKDKIDEIPQSSHGSHSPFESGARLSP